MMLQIDIVCPIFGRADILTRFFESIEKQKNIIIRNIVCPFTLCGDEKVDDEIRDYLLKKKVLFFELNKKEFSHSLTRERAIRDFCTSDIVVLLSQDVIIHDELSLFKLASNIDDIIVYAYGKQICTNRSIEKYIRQKNYGNESFIISSSDIDKLQMMAFFASDAFSAINRGVFLKLNGYRGYDVMMNEDQLYSKFILDAGFKKKYVAEAVVEHSHKYKLKQLYSRYFETGRFYKNVKEFDSYKMTKSGKELAFYVLGQAIKHFDIPVLFRWAPDMASRYLGMKKGRK